jgi:secreted Zn-dependent insulinase-like peptidase
MCCVQVGREDLRRNALAGLLVQLAKRDAFNTLRTQQQLGYIVHMYGSTDLGVQVRPAMWHVDAWCSLVGWMCWIEC